MACATTSSNEVLRCPFRESGCQTKLPESTMVDHAESCKYARYLCPYSGPFLCYFEGNKQQLGQHLYWSHRQNNSYITTALPSKIKISNYPTRKDVYQVIQFGNNIFFWVARNECSRGMTFVAVQYVGPLTWCDRFRYSITLRTADGVQGLTEHCNTTSYQQNPYEVMLQGTCAQFHNSYVELCLDQNQALSMEINVRFLGLEDEDASSSYQMYYFNEENTSPCHTFYDN